MAATSLASVLAVGFLLEGCDAILGAADDPGTATTSDADRAAAASPTDPVAYREVPCPDDVEVSILALHSCGRVTTGDAHQLFVVRIEPPTPSDRAPVVETGTDLGTAPNYAGLAPIAQRTDRPLVLIDLRGTGHSKPLLDCPEVDQLAAASAVDPIGTAAQVTSAVATCRERLTKAGAEPDSVTVAHTAEDLHAVVRALGLDKAVASAHGTTGLVALEWARRHPADLEAIVLDTPYFTGSNPDRRLDALVADLALDCVAQLACRRTHGDLDRRWKQALEALAADPFTVPAPLSTGGDADVLVDADGLRRAARWLMGGGGGLGAGSLPELLDEVTTRRPGDLLDAYARQVAAGPPLCVGYLPKCQGPGHVALGAALALNCPNVASEPLWREPCAAWRTTAAPTRSAMVIPVPTLVLTGRYDPFAPAAGAVERALGPLVPAAHFVEDPAGGHNVLGGDCLRAVRTNWLNADVREPPPPTPCLDQRQVAFPD